MTHGSFRRVTSYHRRSNLRLNSSPRRHPFNGRSFLAGGVVDSGCGWCRRGPRPDGLDHGLAFPWFVSFMLINLGSCVGYHVIMANMRESGCGFLRSSSSVEPSHTLYSESQDMHLGSKRHDSSVPVFVAAFSEMAFT